MRRQLVLSAAAISAMIVLAFVIPLAILLRTIAADRALVAAEHSAETLAPLLATGIDQARLQRVVDAVNEPGDAQVTVYRANGASIGWSAPAGTEVEAARTGQSFTTAQPGGMAVYVPVVREAGNTDVIRAFVPDDVLTRGVASAWWVLGALGVAMVGVATFVADRLARSIVGPVADLADTADALGHGRLEARVEPAGPPEIVEVGHTLNTLAGRIEELLAAERESVADLSHRLRTPVTALKLDVGGVTDPDERRRLAADVQALQDSVDRLINDARHRPDRADASCDLSEVVRERVAFWAALADDQGRPFAVDAPAEPILTPVSRDDIAAALDALLGNVFAHTPDDAAFRVDLTAAEETATLVVEDDGPGFPAFASGNGAMTRGASGGGSSGLGLDIVRATAEAANGSVAIGASAVGGGRVEVVLPRS